MAKSGWYQQKMLKLRKEQVKQRREATAVAIIDENYAEPYKQDAPVAGENSDILKEYRVNNKPVPFEVLMELYGLC